MKISKKIELLAPAGNFSKMKYAFFYGADAVYLGMPDFSLRTKINRFSEREIKKAIQYAHNLKKKIYVTINIYARNEHIFPIKKHLIFLRKIKVDGIIASDPGVIRLVKKYLPGVDIHLSTQANTVNFEAVSFWKNLGIKRIILARELEISEIKEIKKKVPKMELEVFVHGAMCMSYSGRCYLSTYFNSRSANLGVCTQPCRWEYGVYLEEPQKPGDLIKVTSDEEGTYIMNSKDLNLIEHLDKLSKAGVASFKLEGRTKSIYYLEITTQTYRKKIDCNFKKTEIKKIKTELNKIDNRGYTTGFLIGDEEPNRQEFKTSKAVSDWEFVGEVVKTQISKLGTHNLIYIKPHNALNAGESVEIVTPSDIYKIKIKEFFDKNGNSIDKIRGGTEYIYCIELSKKYNIAEMSILRKIRN